MTPAEFLSAVWPSNGIYVLATPFIPPGSTRSVYAHKTCTTIEQAVAFVEQFKARKDIFFGVHSLKQERVYNPRKTSLQTGELGAYEVRTQANSAFSKTFYLDLDVGETAGRTPRHATQAEAIQSLVAFCAATQLPKPLLVSSGTGVHVYWLLETEISSDEWRDHAAKLKQLAVHHGLKADPARTTDSASVLRVAGSLNLKDPQNPRPVRALTPAAAHPTSAIIKLLDDALIRAGVAPALISRPSAAPDPFGLGSNTVREFDGPPVTLKALAQACPTVREVIRVRGNVTEPEWYHTLNLVRFVERGDEAAHFVSKGHPDYDPDATDAKVAQLAANPDIKPTSCLKLAEVCGDELCLGCRFHGKVRSPIVAARYIDPAPPPVVIQAPAVTVPPPAIPDPPAPYNRMKDGRIAFNGKNKEGDEVTTVIYDHDLYPISRLSATDNEKQLWHAELPRGGARNFIVEASALYDTQRLTRTLADQGIYPAPSNIKYVQDYMVAYIAHLQKLADAEQQHGYLGWLPDRSGFILPDKLLMTDGTVRPVTLNPNAARAAQHVGKTGTLAKQVQLMGFYNHPDYIASQFYALCSLGAPLFFSTGHHGVVVNASGEPGASKSTSLFTAASFWGAPELYTINGTSRGGTVTYRDEMVIALANLPVCVDEITEMEPATARQMAMSISQATGRIRVERDGAIKKPTEAYKSTIMLCTANTSLHSVLATDNAAATAGSMRVVEIHFTEAKVHHKYQADDYLLALKENYGHIGEAFMSWVVQNLDAVTGRVRTVMREIDAEARIRPRERFWSAAVAVALVAGEIANKLGLVPYDVSVIRQWVLTKQLPYMRGVVLDEYSSPLRILTDYLESVSGSTVAVERGARTVLGSNSFAARKPTGTGLFVHHDITGKSLWVLKQGFRNYCDRIGANSTQILDDLASPKPLKDGSVRRVVSQKNTRKVLGAGTEYAKAQSWCFVVDMTHPDVADVVQPTLAVSNSSAIPTAPQGHLRPVT